jgi:prephenate dehydrogenase
MMPSQVHDDTVALTSHVPHLLASLMAARLRGGSHEVSRLAGPGLRDVTRIAGGDPQLWGDILGSNAVAVAGVVKELRADLARLASALDVLADPDGGDRAHGMRAVTDLLDRGVAGLAAIPGAGVRASDGDPRIRVAVPSRAGELARLLDAVAAHGIAPEDAVVDAAEGDGLIARFAVPPHVADTMTAKLRAEGWDAYREDPVPV